MKTDLTIMHLKAIAKEYRNHLSECSDGIRSLNIDKIEAIETAIEAMKYKELEKRGLLTIKPCNRGDTVWVIDKGHKWNSNKYEIIKCKVGAMNFLSNGINIKFSCYGHYKDGCFYEKDFGEKAMNKTVFLTEEKAIAEFEENYKEK